MGKPVTVDSDDLEVLLLASAATRDIENILITGRNDPAMRRMRGKIDEVHLRMNRLRGNAILEHEDQLIPVEKLKLHNQDNIDALLKLRASGPNGMECSASEMNSISRLRDQRLVVMGQVNEVTVWGDKTESAEAQPRLRCKITQRGLEWLKEHGHG